MFNFKWFLENDADNIKRINSVKGIKLYINKFIKENEDLLNNMVLVGSKDVERLYSFRDALEEAEEKDLFIVMQAWMDLDGFLTLYRDIKRMEELLWY